MTGQRIPPRFIPTLTEVVETQSDEAAAPRANNFAASPLTAQMQEALVQRVLQRIEQTLALRVREAISVAAVEYSQAATLRIRSELESAVTDLVAEAVASELASRPVASAQNQQKN